MDKLTDNVTESFKLDCPETSGQKRATKMVALFSPSKSWIGEGTFCLYSQIFLNISDHVMKALQIPPSFKVVNRPSVFENKRIHRPTIDACFHAVQKEILNTSIFIRILSYFYEAFSFRSSTSVNKQVSDDVCADLSHEALKNIDPKMVEVINNEIMHKFKPVGTLKRNKI